MTKIAEILKETKFPEKFRDELVKLNGDFELSLDTMVDLGEAYCLLYPESVSHGDSAQVQAGYKIVRFTIIEYIIKDLDNDLKNSFREILLSASKIAELIPPMISFHGAESILNLTENLNLKIKQLKELIDTIPNGVIKERWTGGISVFYNTLYIIKKTVQKSQGE